MMNGYSIYTYFKKLSMNWKNMFSIEKNGILTNWKLRAYHIIFDLTKGHANTLTPLSPNVNNANINSNR